MVIPQPTQQYQDSKRGAGRDPQQVSRKAVNDSTITTALASTSLSDSVNALASASSNSKHKSNNKVSDRWVRARPFQPQHSNTKAAKYRPRPSGKIRGQAETTASVSDDRSLEAYKAKIEAAMEEAKIKGKIARDRKKEERIVKQQDYVHQLLRVQRCLGLLDSTSNDPTVPSPARLSVDDIAPYTFETDVIFIAVDVESFERNHNLITEIGVATLDTRDLADLTPGTDAAGWMGCIRARHFRIEEYRHLENGQFVQGCADNFEFGESEFISIRNAPRAIAGCFKEPFSKPAASGSSVRVLADSPKRNIIFLGHDAPQDIAYLRQIGYDLSNLSNLVQVMDTASMYRARTRESNPRSLGHILYELDLVGWHLHNAGNDAVYTVQVMLAMAVRDAQDRHQSPEEITARKDELVRERIEAAKRAAEDKIREDAEGWSAEEEDKGERKAGQQRKAASAKGRLPEV